MENRSDLGATLTVVPIDNDIWGTVWVSPRTSMQGKFSIIAVDDNDLHGKMRVRTPESDELKSTLSVRVQRDYDIESSIEIKYRGNDDISAFVVPMTSEFLHAQIGIRPNGRMIGIVEVIEPPRITDQIITNMDSTTRSLPEYRYINYGKTSTMLVGNRDGDYYRSLIYFDVSNYPKSLVVEKAKIRLYYGGTFRNKESLELWTADRNWEENSVTHSSRPLEDQLISETYTINDDEKYIEFEVLDYIIDIISGELENFGLIIKSKNTEDNISDSLYTREGTLKPYLEMTYFDTRVWTASSSLIDSTLFARSASVNDLDSTLLVKSNYDKNELEATLYVHRYDTPYPDDREAFIYIQSPELHSTVLITQTGHSDVVSRIVVKQDRSDFFDGTLQITRPEMHGMVYLRHVDDQEATLHVRAYNEKDIRSSLALSIPEVKSTLFIMPKSDLDAFITVQRDEEKWVESSIYVNRDELYGHVIPRVIEDDDLDAELSVRVLDNNDISARLVVNKFEASGTLEVLETNDIDATVFVYATGNYPIVASMNTSIPELHATMDTQNVYQVHAFINVTQAELRSTAHIRAIDNHDVEAFVYPRILQASDIHAVLYGINKYRSGAYYYIL